MVAAVMRAGAAVTHASHPFKELREQISRSNDVGAPCLNERWGSSPMYSSDGLDLPGLWSKKLKTGFSRWRDKVAGHDLSDIYNLRPFRHGSPVP